MRNFGASVKSPVFLLSTTRAITPALTLQFTGMHLHILGRETLRENILRREERERETEGWGEGGERFVNVNANTDLTY